MPQQRFNRNPSRHPFGAITAYYDWEIGRAGTPA